VCYTYIYIYNFTYSVVKPACLCVCACVRVFAGAGRRGGRLINVAQPLYCCNSLAWRVLGDIYLKKAEWRLRRKEKKRGDRKDYMITNKKDEK